MGKAAEVKKEEGEGIERGRKEGKKRREGRGERKGEEEERQGNRTAKGREEGSTLSFRSEEGMMVGSVSCLPPPLAPALAADSRPHFLDSTGTWCHVLKPWSCCLVLLS